MKQAVFESSRSQDFGRQIEYLRALEPPTQFSFLLQLFLVLGGCFAAYILAGWWVCAVWSVIYVALQICEKVIVRVVPRAPSRLTFGLVLGVLATEATVYCFMPLYFWFLGPDVAKFGAIALITASTMHTMLNRAAFPSILLCFLIPDAAVFAVISVASYYSALGTVEAPLYLVGGFAICTFFLMMFFQVYIKEANALKEKNERQRAEAAQQESEVRFRSLFESAPIPIREEDLSGMKVLIDDLGIAEAQDFRAYLDAHPEFLQDCSKQITVVDANRASLRQHGYQSKAELLSKVVGELSDAAMKIVRLTAEALFEGAPGRSYETTIKRADGKFRKVVATWSVIPGHEETYARILLCSIDVTEQKKSEEALRQSQKMETVGQLTGGVAHDFNNLLTVIGGNLDLLELGQEYDPEFVGPIRRAADRGAELTQRLLAFSRKQPLNPQSINLAELVDGMSALIARTLGEQINVETQVANTDCFVLADPGQVEASLLNLAVNSRDAMPDGGSLVLAVRNETIDTRYDLDLDPGEYGVLVVTDTGIGMTPSIQSRAIEPFFTTKEVGKGSGLGLPSVYGFAKQSGGVVHIESEFGVGTTVSLYLPKAVSKPELPASILAEPSTVDG